MASRCEVEVTLISAKDLKNVNWRHGSLSPYAVVWVDPDRKVSTRVDDVGDTSPDWNQKLVLPLDRPIDDETTLYIDIVHANADEDTKPLIGSAKVRLQEVLDKAGGYSASDVPVPFKLELKRPSGRPHGKVKIEVAVCERRHPPLQDPYRAATYGVRDCGGAPAPAPYVYPYSAAPPPQYPYTAAPPTGYPYAAPPYGAAPPPQPQYGEPAYGQGAGYGHEGEKKSRFGGMGTGLAVGAAAGALGGLALAEGFDQLEDHIAEEAAEKVEDDFAAEDDDDGGW